ncbi:DUF885 domain-containing protein [Candidatus Viadribacter manganicus]|uniref:Twin-arginine translocation pathway signal n=1 Tax=Candidatus Viadribacter manganicus TaxID=1759059 RepID=A0A1B1AKG0_9PROT|nr:DUF885 family protein [Candidatus Viadribacter manganicus]ANP47056.1 twin-arginine translocation pathway signal [Candidatus Viadribacter manganicus]
MTLHRRAVLQAGAATLALQATAASALTPDEAADRLLARITEQLLSDYPESATGAGVDKNARARLRSRLSSHSASGQGVIRAHVRSTLSQLRRLDVDALGPAKRLDVDVVKTVYELAAGGFEFPYGDVAILNNNWSYRNTPYVVAQNVGAFVEIPSFLDSSHSINTVADAEAYLVRMDAYARQLDGETVRVRADAGRGVVLPDFLLAKTLQQLRTSRAAPFTQWGIVTSLATRAARANLSPRYAADAARIAEEHIAPAIDRQIAVLESLQARATNDAGVWKLPRGDEYYAWALRAGTTTQMTPDEVHEMGLDNLRTLHGRMDPILRSVGYTEGSVGARMTALASDRRYQFSDGDAGRAEIMAFIQDKLTDIRARLTRAFHNPVRGYLEVVRISPDVEAGAPGAYGGAGTIDGSEPGHFWINLRTPALHTKFDLADLTYHEAIPGHVWQGEYTFRQPLIRTLLGFNAYSEGWALYAQQIADELGVYDDFPVGRLGYLQSLAFRACRLVVDSGIHSKRWTREQGVDFFVRENGSNPQEVQSEVDRYCSWPGQACGYKVGHNTINQLRDNAQSALGARYDFASFNDAVVGGGNVPMTVLGRVIDAYVAGARG